MCKSPSASVTSGNVFSRPWSGCPQASADTRPGRMANACRRRGAMVPFASLRRSRPELDTFRNLGTGDYPSPRYLLRAAGHAVPRVRTVRRSADPLRRMHTWGASAVSRNRSTRARASALAAGIEVAEQIESLQQARLRPARHGIQNSRAGGIRQSVGEPTPQLSLRACSNREIIPKLSLICPPPRVADELSASFSLCELPNVYPRIAVQYGQQDLVLGGYRRL